MINSQKDQLKKRRKDRNEERLSQRRLLDLNIPVDADPLPESVLESAEKARLSSYRDLKRIGKSRPPPKKSPDTPAIKLVLGFYHSLSSKGYFIP